MLKKHKTIVLLAKYLKFFRYRYFRCDNFWIFGNLLDSTVRKAYINNTFEDDALFDKISFFLDENSIYVDVGANYGFYFSGILNLTNHKNTKFHLLEPNKDCLLCLKKTINKNQIKNVFIHGIALDHENGHGIFKYDKNSSVTGSLNDKFINFQKNASFNKSWNNSLVPKLTLDEWMNANSIKEVRVMKLDTSGFDWNIYTGGKNTFQNGRIKVLFFDLIKKQLLIHGTKSSEIIKFLVNNKYTLFNSIAGKEKNSIKFNLHNHTREFNRLNIQKVIESESCKKSFLHIHGLAIHDSFLKQIIIP